MVAIYCTKTPRIKQTPLLPPNPTIAESLSSGHSSSQPHILKKKELKQTPKQIVTKIPARGGLANTSPKGSPLEGRQEARGQDQRLLGAHTGECFPMNVFACWSLGLVLGLDFFASTGCLTVWWYWALGHFVCQSPCLLSQDHAVPCGPQKLAAHPQAWLLQWSHLNLG